MCTENFIRIFKIVFPQLAGSYCYFLNSSLGGPRPKKCNVAKRDAIKVVVQPSYLERPSDLGKDMALIKFSGGLPVTVEPASIVVPDTGATDPLTISGFGFSNVGDTTAGGILQVGWRVSYTFNLPSNLVQWPIPSDAQTSSTWKFDSGGPVFQGFRQGRVGEPRPLLAIIVALSRTDVTPRSHLSEIEALCTGGIAVNSLPFGAATKEWLCSATGSQMNGC